MISFRLTLKIYKKIHQIQDKINKNNKIEEKHGNRIQSKIKSIDYRSKQRKYNGKNGKVNRGNRVKNQIVIQITKMLKTI